MSEVHCGHSSLASLILCVYFQEIPIEEIPSDFVPLKNYFKILLDMASEKNMFILILLGKNEP